jgi:hypothetical protein
VPLAPPGSTRAVDDTAPLPPRAEEPPSQPVTRTATEAPPVQVDASGDRVPVDFLIDEMLADIEPDAATRGTVAARILTWMIDVDERPLVVDRVLLWVHYQPRSGTPLWELIHLYRHPLPSETANRRWHVAMVADAPHVGRKGFAKAPTGSDLDRFLEATWWKFEPDGGFHKLDAQICEHAWKSVIGSPPNHRYR